MKRLLTLDEKNYTDSMPVFERYNVRGVIFKDGKFAMERSRVGEFKFPGGGVDKGESWEEALVREVQEETGLVVLPESIRPIGEILEKRLDLFDKEKVYLCHSLFFSCDVTEDTVEAQPTASERKQGYQLCWAAPEEILQSNRGFSYEKWIARDTAFLNLWMKGEV